VYSSLNASPIGTSCGRSLNSSSTGLSSSIFSNPNDTKSGVAAISGITGLLPFFKLSRSAPRFR